MWEFDNMSITPPFFGKNPVVEFCHSLWFLATVPSDALGAPGGHPSAILSPLSCFYSTGKQLAGGPRRNWL